MNGIPDGISGVSPQDNPKVYYQCAQCGVLARIDWRQIKAECFETQDYGFLVQHTAEMPLNNYPMGGTHFVTSVCSMTDTEALGPPGSTWVPWNELEIVYDEQ